MVGASQLTNWSCFGDETETARTILSSSSWSAALSLHKDAPDQEIVTIMATDQQLCPIHHSWVMKAQHALAVTWP